MTPEVALALYALASVATVALWLYQKACEVLGIRYRGLIP